MGLKLTDKQYHAMAKRVGDAMEKLGIGAFLYWMFQSKAEGIFIGLIFILLSLTVTFLEARE